MPKPLFTRLAAICAVGLFCVLFGCVYALSQKDTILLVMSLLLGVCCIIRFLLLYQAVKAENYRVLEGICVKREKSPEAAGGNNKRIYPDRVGSRIQICGCPRGVSP